MHNQSGRFLVGGTKGCPFRFDQPFILRFTPSVFFEWFDPWANDIVVVVCIVNAGLTRERIAGFSVNPGGGAGWSGSGDGVGALALGGELENCG